MTAAADLVMTAATQMTMMIDNLMIKKVSVAGDNSNYF